MNNNVNNEENKQNIEMPNTVGPTLNKSEVIGEVKKDTQKSPTAMLILFSVLIIAVFLIPEITPYFSNFLSLIGIDDNSEVYSSGGSTTTNNTTTQETPTEEDPTTYYDIVDTTVINHDNLVISNLKKETDGTSYYLTYTIKNNSTSTYSFLDNKVYFDLYNADKTYLDRILIYTDDLASQASVSVKSYVDSNIYENISMMEVLNRTDDDYPEITLTGSKLTCRSTTHSIIYTFSSKSLVSIDDTFTYETTTTDDTFTSYSLEIQNKISELTKKTGVTAAFATSTSGFVTTVKINYKETEENFQSYKNIYYPKDTQAKTIDYELESLGYSCE